MGVRGLFVTGTDTSAGKTLVSTAILAALSRRGMRVAAFKPVETGCRVEGSVYIGEDCEKLAAAAHSWQGPHDVAAYLFAAPAAPLAAAEVEGVVIERSVVQRRFDQIASRADFVLVESAGGLMVPLADGWTTRDLAHDLGFPGLVVVASKLGCINHALLSLEGMRAVGIPVAGYVMNSVPTDGAHPLAVQTNRDMLGRFADGAEIGAMPMVSVADSTNWAKLADLAEKHLDLDALLAMR